MKILLLLLLLSLPAFAETANIKDFGAKGDGVSDDYPALKAAADWASNSSDKTIVFPAGTYLIDRYAYYHTTDGVWKDSKTDAPFGVQARITYKHATNLILWGSGGSIGSVVIKVKADFLVGDDGKGVVRSPITPFSFEYCKNVGVYYMTLKGGAQTSTGVAASYPCMSYGVMSRGNDGIHLSNMSIQYFTCDGIVVGHSTYKGDGVDRNVTLWSVDSHHNARDAMSVISVVGLWASYSQFNFSGYTDGAFPALSPRCGIDVEPEDASPETPYTDQLMFANCYFLGNALNAVNLTAYNATQPYPQVRDVWLVGCYLYGGKTFVNPISGAILHQS